MVAALMIYSKNEFSFITILIGILPVFSHPTVAFNLIILFLN